MDKKNKLVSFIVIGKNIREARDKTDMTQDQVAEKLNMSQLHYGRLERGERKASLEQIAQAARVLNVSVSSLLNGCMIDESFEAMRDDNAQAFGDTIVNFARGCSARRRHLMLIICQALAQDEKLGGRKGKDQKTSDGCMGDILAKTE